MSYFQPGYRHMIVEHSKHGDIHYDAVDLNAFLAACVEILRGREGWFDQWDVPEIPADMPSMREILDMDRDDSGYYRLLSERRSADSRRREALVNNQGAIDAEAIIAAGVSEAIAVKNKRTGEVVGYTSRAWQILEERSDYEYERVELVQLGPA